MEAAFQQIPAHFRCLWQDLPETFVVVQHGFLFGTAARYRKPSKHLRAVCTSLDHVDVPLSVLFFVDTDLSIKAEAPNYLGLAERPGSGALSGVPCSRLFAPLFIRDAWCCPRESTAQLRVWIPVETLLGLPSAQLPLHEVEERLPVGFAMVMAALS